MTIQTSDWVAQIDRMPGNPSFRTYGTVRVAHPGITPTLLKSKKQDKSSDLRLELKLENSGGIFIQVETDKPVTYTEPGASQVTGVSIFFEGKLLHRIDNVLTTN
ncbi:MULTISPECIES: hypothetical protein [unclassified Pseudomonas]|uniref:hypothetical protein n=1 Tax=unclassified Pseudomonas TaxID=196821 RepID=UPI0019141471|nr:MULTISPECIES: hypothetical protein [unclassified Pseudomonas]MBK5548939.1 hypothetical protein [Pseudomonas sp. TH03]MEB0222858.1 hypothetical protein [Pseudomonas sp. 5S1]MEB0294734.1 hypothetical protein [Pseudomonas sp. 10S4]WPX19878.1 hypothetical protein RHM58_07895 [Pseudomonas sp. 10S4]